MEMDRLGFQCYWTKMGSRILDSLENIMEVEGYEKDPNHSLLVTVPMDFGLGDYIKAYVREKISQEPVTLQFSITRGWVKQSWGKSTLSFI